MIYCITDYNLQRLTGQTILIHPVFIRDLTHFRAQIYGCETTLLCCYKDLKFAKQNKNVSTEFKQQYESKVVAATVERVTTDNV